MATTTTFRNVRDNKKYGNQFAYILDCIQSEEKELSTDKEKVDHFFSCFEVEHNKSWHKKAIPNEQDRIADYLQGLPTCCTVEYFTDEIIKIGESWGFCKTEKKGEKFAENWLKVLAFRLIQLRNYFNK